MQIMSNVDIEAAKLVLAIANGTVSTENREQIADMVGGDAAKLTSVLNTFIVNYYKRIRAGNITVARALKTIKAEYKAIGLESIIPYSCWETVVEFFFERTAFTDLEEQEKVKKIQDLFTTNRTCASKPVKVAVDLFALKLMVTFDLIPAAVDFSDTLLEAINAYTQEEKENALLPQVMTRGF